MEGKFCIQGEDEMSEALETQKVDITEFANMVGFPVELIKKELFIDEANQEDFTMADLRTAMMKYLDKTMLDK
ncbi:MAG: hypothetical protein CME62_10775 [Halobacteriovoraceae bacterium]|nr:hypothetical protein [Halobacteriovoraceae bacterium]|tara:strand:- start:12977 stop:13195 length:219 start_codon:yes stop_codon:yes gene_type:complete